MRSWRTLNPSHTLIKTGYFPYTKRQSSQEVLLGLGGNIGDVIRRFEHLFIYLQRSPWIEVTQTAPILKNPPFGYVEQEAFYNTVIVIETPLMPHELLRYVLRIEKHFKRKREIKNGPRTLDIDILKYKNVTISSKRLTLPHSGFYKRESVQVPLLCMRRFFAKPICKKRRVRGVEI
jgi:2-amino-4-hydroxy-6-hydroxymethyldihydropteridine diphosphokinase